MERFGPVARYGLVPKERRPRDGRVRRYGLARRAPDPPGRLTADEEERLERIAGFPPRERPDEDEPR